MRDWVICPHLGHLTFWAGQRYYRRDDIHIHDFYWRDFTGIGAGVEGINIGDSKLAVAYNENATLLKLVASGVSQITDNFEIQPVLVYPQHSSCK
jgi:maltoporin